VFHKQSNSGGGFYGTRIKAGSMHQIKSTKAIYETRSRNIADISKGKNGPEPDIILEAYGATQVVPWHFSLPKYIVADNLPPP
jgi:hypothetical protein